MMMKRLEVQLYAMITDIRIVDISNFLDTSLCSIISLRMVVLWPSRLESSRKFGRYFTHQGVPDSQDREFEDRDMQQDICTPHTNSHADSQESWRLFGVSTPDERVHHAPRTA